MNPNVPFRGIIAYPITPFTADNAVDLPTYRHLVERLVASGSHG
ncbi:MAG: dihydrodipicolinate synthase family protein, partial [Hymenobacter sp.]